MGGLTAGRQALEVADLAPGTAETLHLLRQRPDRPRDPLPVELVNHVPVQRLAMDEDRFADNLRPSRKGRAKGPSGMTNEHLRPLLENPQDMNLFVRACENRFCCSVVHGTLV